MNFDTPGDKCWEFNGTDEGISFGDVNEFTFSQGDTLDLPFSTTQWIKPESGQQAGARLFSKYRSNINSEREWMVRLIQDTIVEFTVYDYSASATLAVRTTGTLTLNQWQLVSTTYGACGDTTCMEVYINATNRTDAANGTKTGTYLAMHNTARGLQFATSRNTICYKGRAADIALWDVALSPTEISNIYRFGFPRDERINGYQDSLVGYWAAWNGGVNPTDMGGINNGTGANLDASNIITDYPN